MHSNANLMKKRVLLEDIQGNEIYPRPALPIGFVIFLNNAVDPNTYFIGTWEKTEEEIFFMTASSNYPAGQVSGSNTHTLTVDEIPPHTHPMKFSSNAGTDSTINRVSSLGVWQSDKSGSTGGGQPFDVRPRRYAVNAWVRVS